MLDRLLGEPGRPARVIDLLFHLPAGETKRRIGELAGLMTTLAGATRKERALGLGQVLLGQGDVAGTLYALEAVAGEAVQDPTLRAYLGYARFLAGREPEGLHDLHQAILADGSPLPHHLLARAYLAKGWGEAARGELLRAQRLDPTNPAILLDLAQAEQLLGDYAAASDRLTEAVALAQGPEEKQLYALVRARFHLESGWDLCGRGLTAAQTLDRLASGWAAALRVRGGILAGCERSDQAIGILQEALRLNPDSAEGYALLGYAYLALGDREAAARSFLQAANREPASRWSRQAREWLEKNR